MASDNANIDPSLLVATSPDEFLHDVATVRSRLRGNKPYYVYVLHRPDRTPFYVGKGVGSRVLNHEAEARNTTRRSHKLGVIRSIHRSGKLVVYRLDSFFDLESEALDRERFLISAIGRHDLGSGPLTNQTDGGEGTSNPSEESRQRRAATLGGASDDPDRRVINELFASIAGQQDSVPIKPLGSRKLEHTVPHPSPRKPSQRASVALVIAALAAQQLAKAGAVVPRKLDLAGRSYVVENGVSKDALKAGMIVVEAGALTPEQEVFRLTEIGASAIRAFLGFDKLLSLGLVEEEVA